MSSQRPAVPPTLRRVAQRAKALEKGHRRRDPFILPVLRCLPRYAGKSDEEIFTDPGFDLSTAYWALAREAGFDSWRLYRQYLESTEKERARDASMSAAQHADESVESPTESPASPSIPQPGARDPVTCPLIAADRADNWWLIDCQGDVSFDDRHLKLQDARGRGAGVRALVGGPSWDHYRISGDVMVEAGTSAGICRIELRAIASGDSVLIGSNGGLLEQFDRELSRRWSFMAGPGLTPGRWYAYEALFDEQGVGHFLDGKVIHYQQHVDWQRLPRLPHGPLEFVAQVAGAATLHVRNLQVKFLRPTEKQLRELLTNAKANVGGPG